MKHQILEGNIVDIHNRDIYFGRLEIMDSTIISIQRLDAIVPQAPYIAPGLVDSHVHIESSMLVPSVFSELVIPCGTVGVVCDPHEIANVMGVEGVEFMMNDARQSPLNFYFGVPSCVPATSFENNGGIIDAKAVESLFQKGAYFLAEMMNFPGVLNHDQDVWRKIEIAKHYNRPIDGHAPGLIGEALVQYIGAGITTDHECSTIEEAVQRINMGMFVQIREGSAARNFNQLHSLLNSHPSKVMLCTDDSHPDDIVEKGHIDKIVRMALGCGISIYDIYQAALINPVLHYHLEVGMLRVGDRADFIIVDNLADFNIQSTYINGAALFEYGKINFSANPSSCINKFTEPYVGIDQLQVFTQLANPIVKVIDLKDGELLTGEFLWEPTPFEGIINSSVEMDVAKIVVVNRYQKSKPAVGFVRGFGLKGGAFGATIAHDSHNVVVVGVDDTDIFRVIGQLFEHKGGIAAYCDGLVEVLPLPVAGLMSNEKGSVVASKYAGLNRFVSKCCQTQLQAPFMTLSFLSLLVIPSLKIGDQGLFDVNRFCFVDLIS
ncbi:MAG: adenine deaminase [Breznakibacter sp.]